MVHLQAASCLPAQACHTFTARSEGANDSTRLAQHEAVRRCLLLNPQLSRQHQVLQALPLSDTRAVAAVLTQPVSRADEACLQLLRRGTPSPPRSPRLPLLTSQGLGGGSGLQPRLAKTSTGTSACPLSWTATGQRCAALLLFLALRRAPRHVVWSLPWTAAADSLSGKVCVRSFPYRLCTLRNMRQAAFACSAVLSHAAYSDLDTQQGTQKHG